MDNYKETLNLPKTDFPMKADLVTREPERLARWEKAGLWQKIQKARAGAEKFVLHDGPPFANGDVHIGTALNKILKDIIVKYQTVRGKSAPYVPGWDCHGLPIEFKVTQEMRKSGATDFDAATVRRACEESARKFIDLQRTQFKRLGVLGDWEHPYLTLNKEYEADEMRLFADVVEKGYVYRGKKPVYWSIPCRTALAEAEVEYADHVSQSLYVKFKLRGEPNSFVVIWTTTPWTLPANLAVAYNSTFHYSMVRANDDVYLVSTLLLPTVAAKCGWSGYEIIRSVDPSEFKEWEYEHPFIDRAGKFFAGDSFVENSTGTGFVHIAPGHGLEDYGVGLQNKLPIYSPVDDDGRLALTTDLPESNQMPASLVGKSILEKQGRSEANEAVIELLKERKALVLQENYSHSYPHCWRSKTPVIFRAMDQWFIRIDHNGFRATALEAIDQIRWVPEWGKNRIQAAVKGRPDWCISRQRSWGVPIPAFYSESAEAILHPEIIRRAADLVEKHGSNIWFERSAGELWKDLRPQNWSGPEAVNKGNDTLDVWIDSGSSSRAVLMRLAELQHPRGIPAPGLEWQADIYLEGSDQHRGWFQSSLLLSLAGNGAPPYRTVLTHGFMVDADREKISKSKQGGYEKPQTADAYVKRYGADVVRLWVASQDYRNDIVVSEERINKVSETYRSIRNTLRYQLSNLYDFNPALHSVPADKLTFLDRWILTRFAALERDIALAYDAFEFHVVYQRLSQFISVELSAIYHDLVKDRLYTDPANSLRRRSTQSAIFHMAERLCGMLAPILSFTADEAWEFLPGIKPEDSVHAARWTPQEFEATPAELELHGTLFALREAGLAELEKARQSKVIGKGLEARVIVQGSDAARADAARHAEVFRELLNVSQVVFEPSDTLGFVVGKAAGIKCERCWHWETDVGSSSGHPTLCLRCVEAVEGLVKLSGS